MRMLLVALTIAGASLVSAAYAGEDDQSFDTAAADKPSVLKKFVRQDSLELPGLTACHQCEWRPKPHEMGAKEQCGSTPDGHVKVGVYECGFSPDCQRVCNFVRCAD